MQLQIQTFGGSKQNKDEHISFTMPSFCPGHTYPDYAISTSSDDDMVWVPCWPLHHATAGYGSFWAPGCGDVGQWLSIDIP